MVTGADGRPIHLSPEEQEEAQEQIEEETVETSEGPRFPNVVGIGGDDDGGGGGTTEDEKAEEPRQDRQDGPAGGDAGTTSSGGAGPSDAPPAPSEPVTGEEVVQAAKDRAARGEPGAGEPGLQQIGVPKAGDSPIIPAEDADDPAKDLVLGGTPEQREQLVSDVLDKAGDEFTAADVELFRQGDRLVARIEAEAVRRERDEAIAEGKQQAAGTFEDQLTTGVETVPGTRRGAILPGTDTGPIDEPFAGPGEIDRLPPIDVDITAEDVEFSDGVFTLKPDTRRTVLSLQLEELLRDRQQLFQDRPRQPTPTVAERRQRRSREEIEADLERQLEAQVGTDLDRGVHFVITEADGRLTAELTDKGRIEAAGVRATGQTALDKQIEAFEAKTGIDVIPGEFDVIQAVEADLRQAAEIHRQGKGLLPTKGKTGEFVEFALEGQAFSDPFKRTAAGVFKGVSINPASLALSTGKLGEAVGEFAFDIGQAGFTAGERRESAGERVRADLSAASEAIGEAEQQTIDAFEARPFETAGTALALGATALVGGAAAGRAIERGAALTRLARADRIARFEDVTDPATAAGETRLPLFSRGAVRGSIDPVEEFKERMATGGLAEAGERPIAFHGTTGRLGTKRRFETAPGTAEIEGLFTSADLSPLRLPGEVSGVEAPSVARGFPLRLPSVRAKSTVAAFEELGVRRLPVSVRTTREASEFLETRAGQPAGFVRSPATITAEQEAIIPKGTRFVETGERFVVKFGREAVPGKVFRGVDDLPDDLKKLAGRKREPRTGVDVDEIKAVSDDLETVSRRLADEGEPFAPIPVTESPIITRPSPVSGPTGIESPIISRPTEPSGPTSLDSPIISRPSTVRGPTGIESPIISRPSRASGTTATTTLASASGGVESPIVSQPSEVSGPTGIESPVISGPSEVSGPTGIESPIISRPTEPTGPTSLDSPIISRPSGPTTPTGATTSIPIGGVPSGPTIPPTTPIEPFDEPIISLAAPLPDLDLEPIESLRVREGPKATAVFQFPVPSLEAFEREFPKVFDPDVRPRFTSADLGLEPELEPRNLAGPAFRVRPEGTRQAGKRFFKQFDPAREASRPFGLVEKLGLIRGGPTSLDTPKVEVSGAGRRRRGAKSDIEAPSIDANMDLDIDLDDL